MNKFARVIKSPRAVAGAVALGALGSANAAVDITAITGAGTDIATVGAAVFVVAVGIKLFKWIRRAL
jgi:hypothetical protein